jgi:uncharacterized phage protein (TIGR02220 family)
MARMSIDDSFLRDPRVARLGLELGMSKREARGLLLDVFALCYDRQTATIPAVDIDSAAELLGVSDAMIKVGLAAITRGGVRIAGAQERIAYLDHKSAAGRIGGLNSGLSRRLSAKQETKQNTRSSEARGNPPDPVPDPPPDPVPVPDQDQNPHSPLGGRPAAASRKKPKPGPTSAESAIVQRVLERLGEHAGHAYGGATEHVRLITARLRDGLTEAELRAVVAYCADEWKDDPKMRKFLRPETLFGPTTITRYLDAARARYADVIAKFRAPDPPLLALIHGGRGAG